MLNKVTMCYTSKVSSRYIIILLLTILLKYMAAISNFKIIKDKTKETKQTRIAIAFEEIQPSSNKTIGNIELKKSTFEPKIRCKVTSASYEVNLGDNHFISCDVNSGTQNITWFKGPSSEKEQYIEVGEKYERPRPEELLITNADAADSAWFTCVVTEDGHSVNCSAFIHVSDSRPMENMQIENVQRSTASNLRENHTLSCTLYETSYPIGINRIWLHNGIILDDNWHHEYLTTVEEGNKLNMSLLLRNITLNDLGIYTCFANNSRGSFASANTSLYLRHDLPLRGSDRSLLITVAVVASGLVILIVFGAVIVKLRINRRRKYHDLPSLDPDNFDIPTEPALFDTFIAYSSVDQEWVMTELTENLTNKGYRVCVDFKDFIPGKSINDNIIRSIYRSHRTVIVMSQAFLRSAWGQFEVEQAYMHFLNMKCSEILLIRFDECKIPVKLMGKTFLDWTSNQVRPHFWPRLYEALGSPQFTSTVHVDNDSILSDEETSETKDQYYISKDDQHDLNNDIPYGQIDRVFLHP